MSKSKFLPVFVAACTVCLLTLGLTPSNASAASKVLKYSDHDPSGGFRTAFYKNVFLEEIGKQTNGRIKIQDFWGGALLSAPEVLQGISDGIADMGMIFADFNPKQLLLHQGFKVFPTGPGNYEVMMKFYQDLYKEIPEFAAEFAKYNQRVIFISPGLPIVFASTKPIDSLTRLKGGKWRASSRWHLMFLKQAGAIATFIPWAECYMALQTGALDGNMTNYDGLHLTKQDEAAPYILVAREFWNATPFIVTMNNDTWESLSREDQAGILKAAEISTQKFAAVYNDGIDSTYEAEKKAGLHPQFLSIQEVNKWADKAWEVKADEIWLGDLKAARIKNAESIVARVKALHQKAVEEDQKITAGKK
jgi:TRAP-type C4-dicarboxylate transport system substrate-binding protein